jgi:hypothetical protein
MEKSKKIRKYLFEQENAVWKFSNLESIFYENSNLETRLGPF